MRYKALKIILVLLSSILIARVVVTTFRIRALIKYDYGYVSNLQYMPRWDFVVFENSDGIQAIEKKDSISSEILMLTDFLRDNNIWMFHKTLDGLIYINDAMFFLWNIHLFYSPTGLFEESEFRNWSKFDELQRISGYVYNNSINTSSIWALGNGWHIGFSKCY